MRNCETTKLFWGQYLYKIALNNRIGIFFRNKNLSSAKQVIDTLQQIYDKGEPLVIERYRRIDSIKESHFLDAITLYNSFKKTNDYMLRVERSHLCIYSSDRLLIDNLLSSLTSCNILEFWEPNLNHIGLLESNTILMSSPIDYEYRVTFGTGRMSTSSFAKWAENNPKQIKIGSTTLKTLNEQGYVNGMYFYARDEKTLQLCNLMLDNIRRIDKIIAKQSLDK